MQPVTFPGGPAVPETKILYVDLDNTLVHFQTGIDRISREIFERHENDLDEVLGIFALMEPLGEALDAYRLLAAKFDTYILSTAPWKDLSAWHDKSEWVQKHLGFERPDRPRRHSEEITRSSGAPKFLTSNINAPNLGATNFYSAPRMKSIA